MTTKERQNKLCDKMNNEPSKKYCPLRKGECLKNCVCYQLAYVTNPSLGIFVIKGGYCDNAMLI